METEISNLQSFHIIVAGKTRRITKLGKFWQKLKYFINMNGIKVKVYKKALNEICDKHDATEDFIELYFIISKDVI